MSSSSRALRTVCRAGRQSLCPAAPSQRLLQTSASRGTDGVFRNLTDERLPTPWIEALKRKQDGRLSASPDAIAHDRDLRPKKMRDSYHRTVSNSHMLHIHMLKRHSSHRRVGTSSSSRSMAVRHLSQHNWPYTVSAEFQHASVKLSELVVLTGTLRLGTVFMDLDALSGIVVYKHTGPGVTTVTAALDRITIAHPLTEICDLEYSGQVTYASGRSSMEVTCKVSRARPNDEPSQPEDALLTCTFTMVALDPITKKPVNVPSLEYDTPQEEATFKLGEAKSLAKKEILKQSLLEQEPNDAESALIHQIWLRQLAYHDPHNALRQPANVTSMAKTRLSTASIMQPQYRNRHQFMIFGGFLLKQTFELAFCCAASFAHARPTFISADPCTFRNPVPVGSVLYLDATVAYTDPPLMEEKGGEPSQQNTSRPMTRVHVRVDSKVRTVEHGVAKPTGQFNYTFSVPADVKVLPHTYQEYMMYLDARRRMQSGDQQSKKQANAGGSGGSDSVL